MGEESSLFSFFFYVLFVYPACNWILKPGRFSRSKGLTYAIGLLVAISAVKTGLELQERGPNFYQMLDVTRGSKKLGEPKWSSSVGNGQKQSTHGTPSAWATAAR